MIAQVQEKQVYNASRWHSLRKSISCHSRNLFIFEGILAILQGRSDAQLSSSLWHPSRTLHIPGSYSGFLCMNRIYHSLFQRNLISRSGGMAAAPLYFPLFRPGRSDLVPSKFVHSINSISNLDIRMPIVIKISRFTKCRPGHMVNPPAFS